MRLLKFFFNSCDVDATHSMHTKADPFDHPDLARMSLTKLADLPLDRDQWSMRPPMAATEARCTDG
jgi:hypothetical protein